MKAGASVLQEPARETEAPADCAKGKRGRVQGLGRGMWRAAQEETREVGKSAPQGRTGPRSCPCDQRGKVGRGYECCVPGHMDSLVPFSSSTSLSSSGLEGHCHGLWKCHRETQTESVPSNVPFSFLVLGVLGSSNFSN